MRTQLLVAFIACVSFCAGSPDTEPDLSILSPDQHLIIEINELISSQLVYLVDGLKDVAGEERTVLFETTVKRVAKLLEKFQERIAGPEMPFSFFTVVTLRLLCCYFLADDEALKSLLKIQNKEVFSRIVRRNKAGVDFERDKDGLDALDRFATLLEYLHYYTPEARMVSWEDLLKVGGVHGRICEAEYSRKKGLPGVFEGSSESLVGLTYLAWLKYKHPE